MSLQQTYLETLPSDKKISIGLYSQISPSAFSLVCSKSLFEKFHFLPIPLPLKTISSMPTKPLAYAFL